VDDGPVDGGQTLDDDRRKSLFQELQSAASSPEIKKITSSLHFVNDISTIVLQDQILDLGKKINRRPSSVNGERKLGLSKD
jgi:hypothetical protein